MGRSFGKKVWGWGRPGANMYYEMTTKSTPHLLVRCPGPKKWGLCEEGSERNLGDFIKAREQDLVLTNTILQVFRSASGLHINPQKCLINPIQCGLEESVMLLQFFPGRLQPFPCKYLGAPLSIHKLKKEDLQPLIDKVLAGLPTWKAGLMSCVGRVVLVKTKMSVVPIHTAIAMVISLWVIQMIDK
jgi:hypothetical protein